MYKSILIYPAALFAVVIVNLPLGNRVTSNIELIFYALLVVAFIVVQYRLNKRLKYAVMDQNGITLSGLDKVNIGWSDVTFLHLNAFGVYYLELNNGRFFYVVPNDIVFHFFGKVLYSNSMDQFISNKKRKYGFG
ncbi:hypothetical protein [Roseivirga seohaensis]|uniref:hypothetical protein n=1 Tax=Roseivirga seohaensis TaxID=1914963 RepID=UPI003BABBA5C